MKKATKLTLTAIASTLLYLSTAASANSTDILQTPARNIQIGETAYFSSICSSETAPFDAAGKIHGKAFKEGPLNKKRVKKGKYADSWPLLQAHPSLEDPGDDAVIRSTEKGAPSPENSKADFEYSISGGACTITRYVGKSDSVIIPGNIDGYTIVAIGDNAFSGRDDIVYVEVPDSITLIGEGAFSDCTSLTAIALSSNITTIQEGAFSNCTNLSEIELPDLLTYIDSYAFFGCSSLTYVVVPQGITWIGAASFACCENLIEIVIPDSVTYIVEFAFDGCVNLEKINMPDSITEIGPFVFSECNRLTHVSIPKGMTEITDYAFNCCADLASVELPESIQTIGESAFNECPRLSTVYGVLGSYAEIWAQEQGYSFIALGKAKSTTARSAPQDDASLRKALLAQAGDQDILAFGYADYDANGVYEAFAILGYDNEDYCQEGALWFVCTDYAMQCETTGGCYPSNSEVTQQDGHSFFSIVEGYEGSGSQTRLWTVQDHQPVLFTGGYMLTENISGSPANVSVDLEGLQKGDGNNWYAFPSYFDGSIDGTGHTWKRYYYYWNGSSLREYGGLYVSTDELKSVPGFREVLVEATSLGMRPFEAYYRGNRILNVNFIMDDEYYKFVTFLWNGERLVLLDSALQQVDNLSDAMDDNGGYYLAAHKPSIADYPFKTPWS